jgi:IclR family pca regulon transcriptional regulator
MPAAEPAPAATPQPADGGTALQRRDWIAGLQAGLGILEAFDDAHARMTAAQMGERVGMTRTAARRHLLTLAHLGYVVTDGKLFWLSARVLRLGQAYMESAPLPRIAQPFLQRITTGTHEAAYLSVMDGDEVTYIARSGSNWMTRTGYLLGARVPAHVTAAGMLMLALRDTPSPAQWVQGAALRTFTSHTITDRAQLGTALAHIRMQDWALSEQQLELNHRGIAVPVRDSRGQLACALSVTMPMNREKAEDAVRRVLGVMREAAQAMRPFLQPGAGF